MLSTSLNLASNVGIQVLKRPLAAPQTLAAVARGLRKGGLEGAAVMRTGRVTGTRFTKFEDSKPLELVRLPGKWDYLLSPWRAVSRALSAEDMLFYKGAEEMRSAMAARMVAKREGLKGQALRQRVDAILGQVPERIAEAKVQALKEGLQGLDYHRRVQEMLEQGRPKEMMETAKDYALRVTFNNQPYGVLGIVAGGFNYMNSRTVVTRFVVPFVNVVANVTNEGLNYFPPVSVARAVLGHRKGRLEGKRVDRQAIYDQDAKAAISTVLIGFRVNPAQLGRQQIIVLILVPPEPQRGKPGAIGVLATQDSDG
jgi:hypothetical protein